MPRSLLHLHKISIKNSGTNNKNASYNNCTYKLVTRQILPVCPENSYVPASTSSETQRQKNTVWSNNQEISKLKILNRHVLSSWSKLLSFTWFLGPCIYLSYLLSVLLNHPGYTWAVPSSSKASSSSSPSSSETTENNRTLCESITKRS